VRTRISGIGADEGGDLAGECGGGLDDAIGIAEALHARHRRPLHEGERQIHDAGCHVVVVDLRREPLQQVDDRPAQTRGDAMDDRAQLVVGASGHHDLEHRCERGTRDDPPQRLDGPVERPLLDRHTLERLGELARVGVEEVLDGCNHEIPLGGVVVGLGTP